MAKYKVTIVKQQEMVKDLVVEAANTSAAEAAALVLAKNYNLERDISKITLVAKDTALV